MDSIETLRIFTTIVKEGSFAAAARRLGTSKALASKAVSQLEARLGVRLLNRTTRALHLTEAGRAYDARGRDVLARFDDLERSTRERQSSPRGRLRIAGPPVFGEDLLAEAVASFLARHPDVAVDLMLEERMVDVVAEGFDVAVRVGQLADSGLVARRIGTHPFVVSASPTYLERRGTPSHPDDLADHDCIVDVAVTPTDRWRFIEKGRARTVAVRPRARVNSAAAAATLVRAGLGVGLLVFSRVRADLEAGRLVRLLERYDAYERGIWALTPPGRRSSALVRTFVAHLVEQFRDGRREERALATTAEVRPSRRRSRR
jgi:DNA-binding transcriptional LysR family regulator